MFGRLARSLLAGTIIGLVSLDAAAAVPRIVGTPRIRNTTFHGVPNTMMYDVRVTVDTTGTDPGHQAIVGFVSADEYTTCASAGTPWKWAQPQVFDTSKSRKWTLYNFIPGTTYYYKVIVGDPSGSVNRVKCGVLETQIAPTPTIPEDLSYLNLRYRAGDKSDPFESKYVMFESDDCGGTSTGGPMSRARYYVLVVDPSAEAIVWYMDVAALTGLENSSGSGFHFIPGATPADDRMLMTVGKAYLYEWSMDGQTTKVHNFAPGGECEGGPGAMGPCVHHDAYGSNFTGNTYVLSTGLSDTDQTGTAWEDECEDSRFLDDGFSVLDSSFDFVSDTFLMADLGFDPTVDGGPVADFLATRPTACFADNWLNTFDPTSGIIDWTHVNSVAASSYGGSEVVDLSLREWGQIVRLDPATGDVIWRLSPHEGYSDWDVRKSPAIEGSAEFEGQHAVHATSANEIMLFDNRGDAGASRVIELELDSKTSVATIRKSWSLANGMGDPLVCGIEGSGEYVPGTKDDHVLAMCSDRFTIVEMGNSTGASGVVPALAIELPDTVAEPFCTSGGPAERRDLQGWHKAFPLARVGEF